jgi:RNA polymerase sigma-70 factor, ECF subfamily
MRIEVGATIDLVPTHSERRDTTAAFDEAFALHHRAVFATARAVVRDASLAEEIAQEVFLRLYRHLDSAPGADLLRPWLLRVTLNEARNTIRSRNRALARDTNYQRTSSQNLAMQFPPESGGVEKATQALDKIKEPMRSCLLLRHQGLSYREIAQTLSLKENYVGSLIAGAGKEFARTYGKIGVNR